MAENKMSELIRTSLDGIRDFTDADTVFGKAVTTPTGVTVIPVSKVSVGFATGGVDLQSKKALSPANFGGGSGTGISITPVAFLTVGTNAEINLVHINNPDPDPLMRLVDLIENTPGLIEKIKNSLTG